MPSITLQRTRLSCVPTSWVGAQRRASELSPYSPQECSPALQPMTGWKSLRQIERLLETLPGISGASLFVLNPAVLSSKWFTVRYFLSTPTVNSTRSAFQ